MEFQQTVSIALPMAEVFAFMKDFENHPQEKGSKVLLVEKLTEGNVEVGTRYREKVRMLPFLPMNFFSEITQLQPDKALAYKWKGGAMRGILKLSFAPHPEGTTLTVEEQIVPLGIMKLFVPIIGASFRQTWENRLQAIKHYLEK
jgi:hypothetical protein